MNVVSHAHQPSSTRAVNSERASVRRRRGHDGAHRGTVALAQCQAHIMTVSPPRAACPPPRSSVRRQKRRAGGERRRRRSARASRSCPSARRVSISAVSSHGSNGARHNASTSAAPLATSRTSPMPPVGDSTHNVVRRVARTRHVRSAGANTSRGTVDTKPSMRSKFSPRFACKIVTAAALAKHRRTTSVSVGARQRHRR